MEVGYLWVEDGLRGTVLGEKNAGRRRREGVEVNNGYLEYAYCV